MCWLVPRTQVNSLHFMVILFSTITPYLISMNYKDSQLAVYNYLLQRHEQNPEFRFSLRNNFATDGSSGLFIGTNTNTPYFCFTLWYVPLTFKGAAGDLLDYAVEWEKDQQSVRLVLQYLIAKSAEGEQNAGSLALQGALREQLPTLPWKSDGPTHSLAKLRYVAAENISTPSALVAALATLLDQTTPGVNAAIAAVQAQRPDWEAGPYSPKHFAQMLARVQMKKADWLGAPPAYYCVGSVWEGDEQLGSFLEEGRWENAKDDFTAVVEQVPVGARLAIKASFVYDGTSMLRVKAYGTVTANTGNGYHLSVKWDNPTIEPFDLAGLGKYRNTIQRLTNQQDIQTIFTPPAGDDKPDDDQPIIVPYALNTILYGPPGTGKTYGTIELAAHIATGQEPDSHAAAKQVFDQLRGDQIEFVTFHQNYAYEDFVLGIRPSLSGEALGFQRQEGVFYRICQRAMANYQARSTHVPATVYRPFREVFDAFIQPLVEAEETGVPVGIEVPMKKGKHFTITALNETNLSYTKPSGGTSHTLALQTLENAYNARGYQEIGLSSYYKPLVQHLLLLGQEQGRTEPLKNYVLVIDEINRANISRVFGELITLLEDDKRLGGDNALTVRLPGGEELAVPPNLYLLGTMNTADKSIALVDVALRRRFEFVGRYPDYDLLDEGVRPVVEKLNKQVYDAKKSADFLIGHAYFLGKTAGDLPAVLNKKVVPLLLEYFSGRTDLVRKQLEDALKDTGLVVQLHPATYQLEVSRPTSV